MQQIQERSYTTLGYPDKFVFSIGTGDRDHNTPNLNVNVDRIEGIFYGLNSLAGSLAGITIRMRLVNPNYSVTISLP